MKLDRDRLTPWRASARGAWEAFWPSRLVVFGVAVWVTVAGLPSKVSTFPALAHPFAGWPAQHLLEGLTSPMGKWDAQHYLAIAFDGYVKGQSGLSATEVRAAFFPVYPESVRILSGFGANRGLVVIMAYAVSLACFFAALMLLHRLTTIELGARLAKPVLLLLAFFPTAFFFGIPYTESMYLLLAVAAFLAARMGNWKLAGVVLAIASATRVPGLLLVVPVALIYLYGPRADREPVESRGYRPRYPVRRDAAWLLLAPLGLLAFSIYLHYEVGEAMAWNHAQVLFGHENVDPLTGTWAGIREAAKGIGDFANGTFHGTVAYQNVMQPIFVAFAIVGGIGALRILPVAYGTWVLVSLIPNFISQDPNLPFWSGARYVAVLFPLFMWLAVVCERREATTTVVALFAAGMAVLTAQFALWSFVG